VKPRAGARPPRRRARGPASRVTRRPHERPTGAGGRGTPRRTPPPTLLALAMDVPASGVEADDWRARNLAELLVQAAVTGDAALVAKVDRAVEDIPAASARFAWRLAALREIAGREVRGRTEAAGAGLGGTSDDGVGACGTGIGSAALSGMGRRGSAPAGPGMGRTGMAGTVARLTRTCGTGPDGTCTNGTGTGPLGTAAGPSGNDQRGTLPGPLLPGLPRAPARPQRHQERPPGPSTGSGRKAT
jgi:hypothetical protein